MGRASQKERVERIAGAIGGVVSGEGYELVDVELVSDRGRAILRVYIDTIPPGGRERGVTVDDCSRISRIVGDVLDVEDILDGQFHLEVSSPGLFRPLTKVAHYERALGEQIKIKTYEKREGRRVFTGILRGYEAGTLRLEVDGTDYRIPLNDIAKANLEPAL